MKPIRLFLSIFLIAALIAEISLGWHLHRQTEKSRPSEESTLEQKRRKLQGLLDEQQSLRAELRPANNPTVIKNSLTLNNRFYTRFAAALQNPEFLRLLKEQQKDLLDSRYVVLFKKLNLAPSQSDKFKDLLVEKQLARTKSRIDIRNEGIDPNNDPENLRREAADEAQKDINAQIKSLLGDTGYAQYVHYQETDLLRSTTVKRLQQMLNYTASPLTDDQAEKLIEVWYQAKPESQKGDITGSSADVGAGLTEAPMALIPDSGLEIARSILDPQQLAAVQHLLSIQQAQQRLKELAAANQPKS